MSVTYARRVNKTLNIKSTSVEEQAYESLIRPSLEYDCSVCYPYNKDEFDQLEMIQRMGASLFAKYIKHIRSWWYAEFEESLFLSEGVVSTNGTT